MAKKRAKTKYFDYSLLVIILFLVCFGLVMVYSTSYYSGMKLPKNPDPAFYLKKQVKSTILGMAAFVFCIFSIINTTISLHHGYMPGLYFLYCLYSHRWELRLTMQGDG